MIHKFNDRELSTVLAALRYWQRTAILTPELEEYDIATENCDSDGPMDDIEIDALCASMNLDGMTFPDCIEEFAAPDDDPHVAAARNEFQGHCEDVSIDEKTVVSEPSEPTDEGRWVMAWVWVQP